MIAMPGRRYVYKYPVRFDDRFALELPRGAQLLDVQMQGGHPQLWALIDTAAPIATRSFRLAGTGHELGLVDGEQVRHVGTFQLTSGALVFHLFEILLPGDETQS